MANKLPWFTHDHSARNDEFLQSAMDRFGHFGYSAFFMILEVIHEHGVGGVLTMTKGRLCLNLRSRWPQVHRYIDFCRSSGKIEFKISGDQVELQNKKFIERQRKMKSNATSKLRERSLKAPLEGDVDGEGEGKTAAPSAADLVKKLSTSGDNLRIVKNERQLLELQLPFSFGDIPKGRRVMDIAASCAQKILDTHNGTLGLDLRRALMARVDLKKSEMNA